MKTNTSYRTATHLVADVPHVMSMAASSSNYGDRLYVRVSAENPVSLCISDNANVIYPMPTDTSNGTCNLLYS